MKVDMQLKTKKPIGLVGFEFANRLREQRSISGRVIPNAPKMVLDTSFLLTQYYKVRIKGKMKQSREKGWVLLDTRWKGRLRVALDYSHQLIFIYLFSYFLMAYQPFVGYLMSKPF